MQFTTIICICDVQLENFHLQHHGSLDGCEVIGSTDEVFGCNVARGLAWIVADIFLIIDGWNTHNFGADVAMILVPNLNPRVLIAHQS